MPALCKTAALDILTLLNNLRRAFRAKQAVGGALKRVKQIFKRKRERAALIKLLRRGAVSGAIQGSAAGGLLGGVASTSDPDTSFMGGALSGAGKGAIAGGIAGALRGVGAFAAAPKLLDKSILYELVPIKSPGPAFSTQGHTPIFARELAARGWLHPYRGGLYFVRPSLALWRGASFIPLAAGASMTAPKFFGVPERYRTRVPPDLTPQQLHILQQAYRRAKRRALSYKPPGAEGVLPTLPVKVPADLQ